MYGKTSVSFSELVGKVLTAVALNDSKDEITFKCADGTEYVQHHDQDCCESVSVEDVAGNFDDIIGSPILVAEESTNSEESPEGATKPSESFTWTFYKIDTAKGGVTIRWLGESNGYYSESVDTYRK